MDKIIKDLIKQLNDTGHAEFERDGLKIEATRKDGCISIQSSYENVETPSKDVDEFKDYIDSLSDDFFIEVAETLGNKKLHAIQDLLDSNSKKPVKEGISLFMDCAKKIAKDKIAKLDKDLIEIEKAMDELLEIRDSYIHVINKTF